ncbi:MAG: tRNA lysidine(34) synthetase TilS, partial [Vicinamibacteria bacterium]
MLLPKVEHAIRRFDLIRPGERVLVAVSGGPDSVALTQALAELAREHNLELRLAHLNHQLRPGSDADEAFCVEWAERLELPIATHRIDVALEARSSGCSIEEQARNSRYRFLGATAARWDCHRVAVGHTRDDQAETFLLRLLRGAGIRGLAAMGPVSSLNMLPNGLIRPMLDVTRSEVLAFLGSRRLPYRQDPSNEDRSIPRNSVRHETLPFLAARHNPNLVATLARTTDLLRDDEDWMEQEAARALGALMGRFEDGSNRLYLPIGDLV